MWVGPFVRVRAVNARTVQGTDPHRERSEIGSTSADLRARFLRCNVWIMARRDVAAVITSAWMVLTQRAGHGA